jgi:hemerythrin superfamily protein
MNTPASGSAGDGAERSPEELREEADQTREELAYALDELESRLSPRRRVEAAMQSAEAHIHNLQQAATRAIKPSITTMIRVDHSHVLAVFRRFRPGISESKKDALIRNACLALEIHAQLEEEIFYPELREVAGQSEALDKSVPEHERMRALIRDLRARPSGGRDRDRTFRELMRVVLHHVADEEAVLLPQAEELMSDRLGDLGLQMTRRRVELLGPNWQEVAASTARTFPIAVVGLAAGVLALGWLAVRPRHG